MYRNKELKDMTLGELFTQLAEEVVERARISAQKIDPYDDQGRRSYADICIKSIEKEINRRLEK